jgi:uncharacterized protein (DUF433 family)
MDWQDQIEINVNIKGGKPVVKGTRVPVEVVVGAVAGGASWEEITEAYAITVEQVQACLAFATEILREEQFLAVPA